MKTWYFLIFYFIVFALTAQDTFRDTFTTVSYSNNDGTQNWSSNWTEVNDTNNGPTAQYIAINSGELTFQYLFNEYIYRFVDLSGYTLANLSFDYRSSSLGGTQELGIYLSNDGGATFTMISSVSGNGQFNQDISGFIASNTVLLFTKSSANWAADDWARIDNVQITAFNNPFIEVDDVSVNEDAGSLTFTLTQLGTNASGSYTLEYSTIDGSALAGLDYTFTSGSLTFSGVVGESQTVTIPINNDLLIEADESFTLSLSNVSDTNINISDTGIGTINSQIPFDQPLVLFDQFAGYVDYTSTAGTFRTADNATDACAVTNTSNNTLFNSVPLTASIKKAYLYWAHSGYQIDNTVTFEGQTVNADRIYESGLDFNGQILTHYGYVSDVTSIIASIGVSNLGSTTFDVSDLTIDSGSPFCDTATVMGGWALMIFYEDASLPASNINLYEGFDGLSNAGNSFTLDSFFAIASAGAKASFLSWEGDASLDGNSAGTTNPNGESLSITNQANFDFTLSGDGGQTGNNAYNSTAFDNTQTPIINDATLYGVDWDTFDISTYIAPSDTQVTANVNVGQDYLISNAVVIKVPSNLVTGYVFEDVNYPGGVGRNRSTSSGIGIEGAVVELYNSLGLLVTTTTTDANGQYIFAGMADGTYSIRVVNSSITSNRGGGNSCANCYAVQTFRSFHNGVSIVDVVSEVGGSNPSQEDVAAGNLIGAQTVSNATLASNGIVGIDFGFNFNTIVNTNESGQGSYEQFIINSNNLDQNGLNIEANTIFDPPAGVDLSIFMIPPTGDALGRTADANFNNGYFDIFFNNTYVPTAITDANTSIDGRTQTAYSGNTNAGTVGAGGTMVGVNNQLLPSFQLPEIQIHRNAGDVIKVSANATQIRNLSIYANNNAAIRINSGDVSIQENLIGVNALGTNAGNIKLGINNIAGNMFVEGNYIATNTVTGVLIAGGSNSQLIQNHISSNGATACDDNIRISGGTGIEIRNNLIENAASIGIDAAASGNLSIVGNTIKNSGQNGGNCGTEPEQMGIELGGSNSSITDNVIYENGGAGLTTTGTGIGNLISKNSFYSNGVSVPALGIDLMGDGVTINDLNDSDGGSNNLNNFPIISSAYISGQNLIVMGWVRSGAIVEFYFTDINEGSAQLGDNSLGLTKDYGEGQTYIGTGTEGSPQDLDTNTSSYAIFDGNTDDSNRFKFSFPLPIGTELGNMITATSTISNSTSEFSPMVEVKAPTVITNRRITYRVKN